MVSGRDWNLEADSDSVEDGETDSAVASQVQTLQQLVEQVGDFVVAVDGDGNVRHVDDGVESVLGYEPETLVDEPLETLLAGSPEAVDSVRSTLLTETPLSEFGVRLHTADDAVVHAQVSTAPAPAGEGCVCLVRDVTEHRRRERELEGYVELAEAIGDPMFVLDTGGRFEQVNQAMAEYTGYDPHALLGRSITELVPTSEYDRITRLLADPGEGGDDDSVTFETTLVTSEGEQILSEANVTVLRDDRGRAVGSVGVLRDIRERKRREQDLVLLKQVLTRVFRHNIRNELLVVQGFTDLIESTVAADISEYRAEIDGAIESLLEYSEKAREIETVIESPERSEMDLAHEIRQAVTAVQQTHPDAHVSVSEPSSTSVDAHPKIVTAIEELLDNAIRHTPDDRVPEVEVWTDEADEFVTLYIEDNAGGLDDNEIAVLQRGAESNLEHSSGVGLWLVRWIVEYSGSELIVHATEDGSLMGIRFRKASSGGEHTPAESTEHVRQGSIIDRLSDETVVGRRDERYELERAYNELEHTGGRAVFVTGRAGMGKSTLVEDFLGDLADDDHPPLVATGYCEPGLTPPYRAIEEALADLPIPTEIADLLEETTAVGVDDAETGTNRRQELFAGIAAEIRQLAADQPVVIVFEDLHWAGRETVDLLEFLLDEVGRWAPPVLFIGTCRTTDVESRSPVEDVLPGSEGTGRERVLELEPLTTRDVRALLAHLLDTDQLPDEFVDAVHSHTGGTPLFVNEVVRHFVETVGPAPAPTELPTDFDDVAVPDTVERAVRVRLDSLSGPAVSLLELGAVIGETISLDVLLAASELSEDDLFEYVSRLTDSRLWERTDGQLTFVHGLVREQTLDGLGRERRQSLHARVARAIETVFEDDRAPHYGQLAAHYQEAGDAETAFEYYTRAGRHAADAFAHRTAIEHYEAARSLARTRDAGDEEDRIDVQVTLATMYNRTGEFATARETARETLDAVSDGTRTQCRLLGIIAESQNGQSKFDDLQETASKQREIAACIDARDLEADARIRLGRVAYTEAEYETAREYYQSALRIATDIGDRKREAESRNGLGNVHWRSSQFERAESYHQQVLSIARELGHKSLEAKSFNNLGMIADDQGLYEQATHYYTRSIELRREMGDKHGEAGTLNNIAIISWQEGEYDQARRYFEQSLELRRSIGNERGIAIALSNLGVLARTQGEYDQARTYLEQNLERIREIGDRNVEANCLNNLAQVFLSLENDETAERTYREGLDIASELDIPREKGHSLQGLADVYRRRGNYDRARSYLADAEEVYETTGAQSELGECALLAGRIAVADGEYERARSRCLEARNQFSELGETLPVAQCDHLLGNVADATDDVERARAYWTRALETFAELGARADSLDTLERLVESYRPDDDTEQAREYLQQAESVLDESPEELAAQHQEWIDDASARLDRTL